MLASARELRKNGVLGLNERNANVIQVHNPRRLYPLVDDKLRTKQLALKAGIAVPELYGVVASQHDVRRLSEIVGQRRDFVIKPAHGTGGDGILVVADHNSRREGLYRLVTVLSAVAIARSSNTASRRIRCLQR
jgi:glutathione synthase/RimK-type ligase-like ATP-grasp enzyme